MPSPIGTNVGVPTDTIFSGTRGQGTTLVINTETNEPYYVNPGVGVQKLGPGEDGYNIPLNGYYLSASLQNPSQTLGYGTWLLRASGAWNL